MRVVTEDIGKMRDVKVAYYSNPADLAANVKSHKAAMFYQNELGMAKEDFSGASFETFQTKAKMGDVSYARRAEKLVDQFANLSLKDYARVLDYNLISGQLDYQAAMGGDPMCMYGQTIVETDVAPVHIYIDAWTSFTVPKRAMERRGIAVLALTLALSVYRPVMTKLVTGLKHRPSGVNSIQVISVPTTPMDLSLASWMIGDPSMFRRGLMSMAYGLGGKEKHCGLPALDDTKFQTQHMGRWLADKDGVRDVVFLPMMYGAGEWDSDDYVQKWLKTQLTKFVG